MTVDIGEVLVLEGGRKPADANSSLSVFAQVPAGEPFSGEQTIHRVGYKEEAIPLFLMIVVMILGHGELTRVREDHRSVYPGNSSLGPMVLSQPVSVLQD